jgi:hypothetical protein
MTLYYRVIAHVTIELTRHSFVVKQNIKTSRLSPVIFQIHHHSFKSCGESSFVCVFVFVFVFLFFSLSLLSGGISRQIFVTKLYNFRMGQIAWVCIFYAQKKNEKKNTLFMCVLG